jgi:naphthoate synthase
LNILEVQRLICFIKVVIAVVPGWAVVAVMLHVVCDLTLASKEHAILSKQMQM